MPSSNEIVEWVNFYYDSGFSIIPCKRTNPPTVDNKLPNLPSWKEYMERRPTPEEIQKWLDEGLFQNIGLVLGKVSGNIVAIDLDDPDIVPDLGLDLDKIIDEGNWVQATGKPGRYHIICKNKDDPGNTIKDNAVHLEHRGNGSYIVVCPSQHPNGNIYHFLNYEKPKDLVKLKSVDSRKVFTDMIQKLYEKRGIKRTVAPMPVGERDAKCVENALQKGQELGARNDTAYMLSAYYRFVKKLQPEEIKLLVRNWNKKNAPPLPESELDKVVSSALNSGKRPGCNRWQQLALCPYENKNECPFLNKPKEKTKKEEKEIVEATMVINDGNLYEQVYDSKNFVAQYVCLNEGQIQYVDELEYNGATYRPVNEKTAIESGAIFFPSKPEEYGSLNELMEELNVFIRKYMDISDSFLMFSTWYILFSWLLDNINTAPYLRVIADFSSGKSRFIHTVGRLCYKPTIVAGATTTASIFRSIERWRGTLILEEYNPEKSGFEEDETKILNCGFERGTPVVRCHKETNKLEYFNCFGAKVISSRQQFKDEALNSRCLTEILVETDREDIPVQLPERFFIEQKNLRNKLLMFRLRHWKDIDPEKIQELKFPVNISRRLRQAFSSFAIIFAHDKEALELFMEYIEKYNKELIEDQSQTFDGMLVNAFFELKKEGCSHITSKMIGDQLYSKGVGSKNDKPYNPTIIAKHFKSLGMQTKARRIGDKISKVFIEDTKCLEKLKRKYVVGYDDIEEEIPKNPNNEREHLDVYYDRITENEESENKEKEDGHEEF